MSLTFKLLSLAIRTAAKPIGDYIKRQAKEHDGFRRFAVRQAQRVHQVDMTMRLGILHDHEAQQRMHEREKKAAEERMRRAGVPTARTEEEQKRRDEAVAKAETEGRKKREERALKVKIRPLSDAKAIELGANFFSEAFIFAVAAGLIIWDSWRSRRKETARRDDVADRLDGLEAEVQRLRSKYEPELSASHEKLEPEKKKSWLNPAGWWSRTEPDSHASDGKAVHSEKSANPTIPGSVPIAEPELAVKPATANQGLTKSASAVTTEPQGLVVANSQGHEPADSAKNMSAYVDSVAASRKER